MVPRNARQDYKKGPEGRRGRRPAGAAGGDPPQRPRSERTKTRAERGTSAAALFASGAGALTIGGGHKGRAAARTPPPAPRRTMFFQRLATGRRPREQPDMHRFIFRAERGGHESPVTRGPPPHGGRRPHRADETGNTTTRLVFQPQRKGARRLPKGQREDADASKVAARQFRPDMHLETYFSQASRVMRKVLR